MRFSLLAICCLFTTISFSQINDCIDAIVICANDDIGFNPNGAGLNDFADPDNNEGCIVALESNSAWYYFEIEAGAPIGLQIGFTISPNGGIGEDYDWAVFGPDVNCDNLGSPLRCSSSSATCGFCPETGIGNGTTDTSEGPGTGDGFVSLINVVPGQGFYLMIDNWAGTNNGFLMTWTGSAAPYLNCAAETPCVLVADAGIDVTECEDGNSFLLTGSSDGNDGAESYIWTGTNGGTAYLNNPNLQSPTVTLPNGVSGSITYTLTVTEGTCIATDEVVITVNPIPSVSLFPVGPFCPESQAVSLTASPFGGTWTGAPGGLFNPQTNGSGTHPVTYTYIDGNGCSNSAAIDIIVYNSPSVSISPDNPASFCTDDGVLLTATGSGGLPGYSYEWATPIGGGTDIDYFAFVEGSYDVLVTDFNGCTATESIVVIENYNPIVATVDPGPLCETIGFYTLMGTPSGGTWSGPFVSVTGNIFPSSIGEGAFSVTYTYTDEFGCSSADNLDVLITSPPLAIPTNNGPYCTGETIELFGNTDGNGANIIYFWEGPNGYVSNVQNPTNATASGSYSLLVTIDDCTSNPEFTTVVLAPTPDAVASNDGPYCPGQIIQINGNTSAQGTSTSYAWTGPNGYVSSIQNPNNATESGFYELIITVDGCESTPVFTEVSFNNAPDAEASNSGPYCIGDNILLSSSTNTSGTIISYSWTGPGGYVSLDQNPIDATVAGTYTVTIDVDGCQSAAVATQISINALPVPSITGDSEFCQGNTITIDAGLFSSYDWSDGTTNQTLEVNSNGTFSVTVTNAAGCSGEDQYTVIQNNNPVPNITGPSGFCTGESISLDAGVFNSYEWGDGTMNQTLGITTGATYSVTVTDGNGCTGEDQLEVIENMITTPTITGTLDFCNGEINTLDAGTYNQYLWTGGTNNQTLDVNTNGDYGVTVTDINGCTAEDMVTVNVNVNPTPVITGDDTFCEGASSTLDAGTFQGYLWSDGSANQELNVNTLGTYGVTVTDANGCTGEDEINIMVNTNPEPAIAGSTSFCSGSSTTLDAGGSYDTYLWSDNSGNQTLNVGVTGNYSVTVTDGNGCTGEAAVMVDESNSLNPVITGNLEYCVGGSTVLDAGTGFDSYLWTDSSIGQTFDVTGPGDYAVTVTDGSGCSGETLVSVLENNLPSLTISGNIPICTGAEITLNAGNGFDTYIWSDMSLNQTLLVEAGGTFSVVVTDANNCSNEATVDVVENPNPIPVISGDSDFCVGEVVTLATGIYDQYEWSDNSGNATLDITTGGTYAVIVTDTNNCTGEAQFNVVENQLPEPTINGDPNYCEGSMASISVNEIFADYNWSNTAITQSININTPGNLDLVVTDANGCMGTTSILIVENPNPTPQIAGSTTFCIGSSTIIDAGAGFDQYQWSDGSANQTLETPVPGPYSVIVIDNNGCTGTDNIAITESQVLEPIIAGDLNLCDGENSTLDAGAGFTTYLWSTGAETQTINTSTTDDYTVTVSDSQGCTGETMASLVVNQNPSVAITGETVFCTGEVTTLDAGTGYDSYSWSNGSLSQTINVTQGNTYTVTVSNVSGCTNESSLIAIENQVPTPTIVGPNSFCIGNTVTLDAGAGYDAYSWSDGSITQTVIISSAIAINVFVTDANGCTGTDQVNITENASLSPTINGVLAFCDGENTVLDAGAGFESYEWTTGEVTETITVNGGGSYTVIVTDVDGCSGSDNVAITEFQNPNPVIAGSTTFCTGSSATLDAGAYASYLWSDGSIAQTITVNTPGMYTVEVVDQNTCVGQAFINVTESTSLSPVISGSLSFCENGNTTLNAGAGFDTYLWTDGSANQTLDVFVTGFYSVTVSDGQGCTGMTTVSVGEVLPPTASVLTEVSTCNTIAGGSVLNLYDLVVSGDMNGIWTDTDNSGAVGLFNDLNFNNIPAGNYNFVYTTNSSIQPCTETTYPVVLTVIDCNCLDIQFIQADPLCNSGDLLDLTTLENTSEPGTWIITQGPAGATPATINGNTFSAVGADGGGYMLEFELMNAQPPGCPQEFLISVTIDLPAEAGSVTISPDFCEEDNQLVDLASLTTGADLNGAWTETSIVPSQGGVFDPVNGSFSTAGQSSGIYTFLYTVSSGGACPDDFVEVNMTINDLPSVVTEATANIDCLNPTTGLNANGSSTGVVFDIAWNGPGVVIDGNENTLNPTVNASGIYSMTITNVLTGCMETEVVQVIDNFDNPLISAGNNQTINCAIDNVNLQAFGDINPPNQILWDGPGINAGNETSPTPNVTVPGIYNLTITNLDNGCTSTAMVEVLEDMDLPIIVIQFPLQEITCTNPLLDLISESPTLNATYQWFDDQNTLIGNTSVLNGISEPGLYSLIVTGSNGCTELSTIELIDNMEYPLAEAGEPSIIDCNNIEANLDGSGSDSGTNISYSWSGPGLLGPNDELMTVAGLAGIYELTVINTSNGCTAVDQVEIDEDREEPIVQINQPEELDCTVESTTLNGEGSSSGTNFTYSWQDASGTVIATSLETEVQNAGIYTLLVLNTENGCNNSESLEVIQNSDVPTASEVETFDPDCIGDTDGFIFINGVTGGVAPYSYSFEGADFTANSIFGNLSPGTYDIIIQDANGCELEETIIINPGAEVNLNLGGDQYLELGESTTVTAILNIPSTLMDTIIWSTSGALFNCEDSTCLDIGINTFNTIQVGATVSDINGCRDDDMITINMDKTRAVFIPNAFSPNGDGVNDRFIIYANRTQIERIPTFRVFNRWGEVVYEEIDVEANKPDGGWDGTFKGERMDAAVFIYIAEIEFIDGRKEIYKGDVSLVK